MGIIIKQKEIAKGAKADVYIKIDSVRAGQGEVGKITCSCGEWIGTESRKAGENNFRYNVPYHIPDENIISKGGTLIEAVYPAFKKYFENLGYSVLDDSNTYGEILEAKEQQAQVKAEVENDGTE